MNRMMFSRLWLIGILWIGAGLPARAVMIGFDPGPDLSVVSGTPIDVDVVVSGLAADNEIVSAYDLDVTYDAAFLSPTAVTFGPALGDPFAFPFPEVLEDFNLMTPGVVDFAALSFLDDAELDALQGDSVVLATLRFDVNQTGDTSLGFVFGPGQDVKGRNAQVIIPAAVPEPPTCLLLLLGALAGPCRKHLRLAAKLRTIRSHGI